jgi:hypothetical protein
VIHHRRFSHMSRLAPSPGPELARVAERAGPSARAGFRSPDRLKSRKVTAEATGPPPHRFRRSRSSRGRDRPHRARRLRRPRGRRTRWCRPRGEVLRGEVRAANRRPKSLGPQGVRLRQRESAIAGRPPDCPAHRSPLSTGVGSDLSFGPLLVAPCPTPRAPESPGPRAVRRSSPAPSPTGAPALATPTPWYQDRFAWACHQRSPGRSPVGFPTPGQVPASSPWSGDPAKRMR